jgi:SH3-like domain-containing protein
MFGKGLVRTEAMVRTVGTIDDGLTVTLNRRRLLRVMAGAGAAAAVGGLVTTLPARAAAGSWFITITALNLRAKPSTSAKVLAVMPPKAKLFYLGTSQNGFSKVEYNGMAGWAYDAYLTSTHKDAAPPITGEATTTSAVNFREGPSTGDRVIGVLPAGTWVGTSDTVVDGFRHVQIDNGTRGWVYDEFLGNNVDGIEPGQILTVTSALNLRAKPSTSATVLTVMKAGAKVTAMAQSENGFRSVTYGSIGGWAYEDYLA